MKSAAVYVIFSVLLSAGKESVKGRPREVCDLFVNSSKLFSTTNYDKPLHLLPWLKKPVNRFSLTDYDEILPHKYSSNVVTASFLYRTKTPSLQSEITPHVPWSISCSVAMSVGKPELIFECVAVHKLLSKATNHRVFIYSEIAQLTRELEEKEVSKFTLYLIIVNLLTLYYKCQNLMGYTTRYPFWDTQRVE